MENIKNEACAKHHPCLGRVGVALFLLFFTLPGIYPDKGGGKGWGWISSSFAQTTNDAGLWTTLNFEKKLNHNFFILVTEEFRLRENFTRLNLFYTEIGAGLRPFKFLKIAASYRMIDKFVEDNTFSYRHRLMFDITLKDKIGPISLSFRQRLQSEVRNVYSSDDGSVPEWYFRSKVVLKYDLDKLIEPYVGVEVRYQIRDHRNVESNMLWHRQRYFIGLDYKKNDVNSFGVFYLFQDEFNVRTPQNLYIVGLEYKLTL